MTAGRPPALVTWSGFRTIAARWTLPKPSFTLLFNTYPKKGVLPKGQTAHVRSSRQSRERCPRAFCAFSDRLPPRRRSAYGVVQLALRQARTRHDDTSHRGYRRRAQQAGTGDGNCRGLEMAGRELGRRAVLSVATHSALSGSGKEVSGDRSGVPVL